MKHSDYWLCPSILSADFSRLGEEVQALIEAGADRIHFDVMDNHYVPNLTFGPMILSALKKRADLPFDVHLMVDPVEALASVFMDSGADSITFHPKVAKDVSVLCAQLRSQGVECGLALNPNEPIDLVEPYLAEVDRILIMSVFPGFGGQAFMPSVLEKVETLSWIRKEHQYSFRLEMDGGISPENILLCQKAGAESFVMGSAVFKHPPYQNVLNRCRSLLQG